ncbi:MAG: LysR family transcriptional regulator [Gammaproteobacteria bacterium]|jgi:DNA-binding transcriptional LysR family regulator
MEYPRISLEQWRALVAVVEAGGYAQAASQIHKSQSTLSHAIQQLERLIGAKVFEIQGRKSVLTDTGEVLYRRGKALVDEALQLERAARKLAAGWESEIHIAVEILFPGWLLFRCLNIFGEEQPDIHMEIYESVMGGTDEALTQGRVDLAIGTAVPEGYLGDPLMQVRVICAAHPDHPLHQLGRPLTQEDLSAHRQLVIRDSGTQRTRKTTWLNERRWTFSHRSTAIRAAMQGLGYAWFPEEIVREELDAGTLKPLPLQEGGEQVGTLYLMYADREAAGPGVRRIAELLHEVSACVRERCGE